LFAEMKLLVTNTMPDVEATVSLGGLAYMLLLRHHAAISYFNKDTV